MTTKPKLKLPVWAVLLDVLGALMLGVGLILFNGGAGLVDVSPDEARGPGIALIAIGVTLMVPLIVVILSKAKAPR